MNIKNKDNLIFFGELPSRTIHGASISNAINLEMLSEILNIYSIEEEYIFKSHNSFSFNKIYLFLKTFFIFFKTCINNSFKFYYGVIYLSTFGIIKNILCVFVFKLTNPNGKVILHFHRSDFDSFYNKILNKTLFLALNSLTHNYILLSDNQKKQFNKYNINNTSVLYNTIECEIDTKNLKEYSKNKNIIRILFISNLIREKGIIELINAIKILNNDYKNIYQLEIFGNNTNEKLDIELNTLLHNESNIVINEPISKIDKFNKIFNSDILILPSYNEGLPLTLLECIYLNKPIIISNVGYISEVLGDDYPLYCIPKSVESIIINIQKFTELYFKREINLNINKYYYFFSRDQHKIKLHNIFN